MVDLPTLWLISAGQIVAGSKDASDSFIIQWAQRWLPEDNKYRSLDTTAVPSDQSKVDNLLMQFMSGGDIRTKLVSLSVCLGLSASLSLCVSVCPSCHDIAFSCVVLFHPYFTHILASPHICIHTMYNNNNNNNSENF